MFNFVKYSNEYDRIIDSLTIASEFSYDFKKNVDEKMYKYVVGSRTFDEGEGLEEVQQAWNVVYRLKSSTIHTDNIRRLQNIERMLALLEKNILILQNTNSGYDFKEDWLDKRVWMLTSEIKQQMQAYIYYETTSLAQIRSSINREIQKVVVVSGVLFALLAMALFFLAIRVSGSIAKPIRELSDNIRSVGEGDFTVRPVSPGSNEVQALNEAFEAMVERIRSLMDNIRQKQDNLRMAEFRLLQAQINPHFLYNTLDTVIWLAEDKQNDKVIQLITSLSLFFRNSLSNGKDIITVKEEALHVQSYLEIQQMRYSDILSYNICIPKEMAGCLIPKLTLQPLVENALYHGIKNKRGMGNITITGAMEGKYMVLTVEDDGIGMSHERLVKLRELLVEEEKASFGVSSILERLALYYQSDFDLAIQSEYSIGTKVTVKMPAEIFELKS